MILYEGKEVIAVTKDGETHRGFFHKEYRGSLNFYLLGTLDGKRLDFSFQDTELRELPVAQSVKRRFP